MKTKMWHWLLILLLLPLDGCGVGMVNDSEWVSLFATQVANGQEKTTERSHYHDFKIKKMKTGRTEQGLLRVKVTIAMVTDMAEITMRGVAFTRIDVATGEEVEFVAEDIGNIVADSDRSKPGPYHQTWVTEVWFALDQNHDYLILTENVLLGTLDSPEMGTFSVAIHPTTSDPSSAIVSGIQ